MPPTNRHDAALRAALAANTQLAYNRDSQVARLGNLKLTNARGETTPAGLHYQTLTREQGIDASLDPWTRGTITRGQSEYAKRRSGTEKVVGRWRNGSLIPTRGAGEQYYGHHREEYILNVPVVRTEYVRDGKGRWGGMSSEETTIPLH